jgi:hypothetical protein
MSEWVDWLDGSAWEEDRGGLVGDCGRIGRGWGVYVGGKDEPGWCDFVLTDSSQFNWDVVSA